MVGFSVERVMEVERNLRIKIMRQMVEALEKIIVMLQIPQEEREVLIRNHTKTINELNTWIRFYESEGK
jgi:hypothetical protein